MPLPTSRSPIASGSFFLSSPAKALPVMKPVAIQIVRSSANGRLIRELLRSTIRLFVVMGKHCCVKRSLPCPGFSVIARKRRRRQTSIESEADDFSGGIHQHVHAAVQVGIKLTAFGGIRGADIGAVRRAALVPGHFHR